jgi:uracil-DNA glycosylase
MSIPEALREAYAAHEKEPMLQELRHRANGLVPGEGPLHSPIMIIGEAPGLQEDRYHRPFIGAAGQLLRDHLRAAGIDPALTYITNVLKYRPRGNRTPYNYEVQAAQQLLMAEITAVDPLRILALGGVAHRALDRIGYYHVPLRINTWNPWHPREDSQEPPLGGHPVFVLPLRHPAYLLRKKDEEEVFQSALQTVLPQLAATEITRLGEEMQGGGND